MLTMVLSLALFAALIVSCSAYQSALQKLKVDLISRSNTRIYAAGRTPLVPYYPDRARGSKDYMWMDIYNALGRERTLFVSRYIDDEAANQLIASLVWLQGQSASQPITIYFNVPGAMVKPTFAIYDVMKKIKCPIKTINMGLTVGMSCLLVAAGTRGNRLVTPNARFLMGKAGLDDGLQGQSADIAINVMEVMKDNRRGMDELARYCRVHGSKIEEDMKRDFYLTAPEAVLYGLVDDVMMPQHPIKIMKYRGVDDDTIGFGHFSEVRKVKAGPDDVVQTPEDVDERAMKELMKKKQNNKSNRFANARVKPPGWDKPPPPGGSSGGGKKFTNSGF